MSSSLTPDYELYDKVMQTLETAGYNVYDYLPDASATYPFVYVGDTNLTNSLTKSVVNGTISLRLNVWGKDSQKREVATIVSDILRVQLAKIKKTDSYNVFFLWKSTTSKLLTYQEVDTRLVHGIIDAQFKTV